MKKQKLEEIRELLVVVDMVNGFVREGVMSDKYIERIIPGHLELFKDFQEPGKQIAFIKDTHKEGCNEFNRYPVHCIDGTSESKLVSEFIPYEESALVYRKNSTSTIFAPNFMTDLEQMKKLREVIITGCCTDICVINLAIPLQNYFDQHDLDTTIYVPKDLVETYDSPTHNRDEYNEMAFRLMENTGIKLVKKIGGNYGK